MRISEAHNLLEDKKVDKLQLIGRKPVKLIFYYSKLFNVNTSQNFNIFLRDFVLMTNSVNILITF